MIANQIHDFVVLLLETISMAVIGAGMGALIAIPVAYFASTLNNGSVTRKGAWFLINFTRGIPSVIYALIIVKTLGQGTFSGILALTIYSSGMIAKQVKDILDREKFSKIYSEFNLPGLTKTQIFISATLPSIYKEFVDVFFHRIEVNVRIASVLGIIGAGGIGVLFADAFAYFQFQNILIYTTILTGSLIAIEWFAKQVRGVWLRNSGTSSHFESNSARSAFFLLLLATSLFPFVVFAHSEGVLERALHMNLQVLAFPEFNLLGQTFITGTLSSVVIAVSATGLATLFAIPSALYSAKMEKKKQLHKTPIRIILTIMRSIPDLIFVLLFVTIFGLEDTTVIVALAVGSIGTLGRFISNSLEETNSDLVIFGRRSGMSAPVFLVSLALRNSTTAVVRHVFHMMDINLRLAIALGVVGLGGLGTLLTKAVSSYEFGTVSAIVLGIVVLTNLFEWVGKRLSSKLGASR